MEVMKKWLVNIVYYLSILLPCSVTCWTLCFGTPSSTGDKVLLVALTVGCVACNAILRQSAVAQSESQIMLAREQNERIKFLQCHAKPTMQMIREVALGIIRISQKKGFVNNCDLSTRDFVAVASFRANGSITHVERFMRMDDYEVAQIFGSGGKDLDSAIEEFMFTDIPFPKGSISNFSEFLRCIGRFALRVLVPVYGVRDCCFFDEKDHKIWVVGNDDSQPGLTLEALQLGELIGVCRWEAYAKILTWASEAGMRSLNAVAASTPDGRWT